MQEFVVYQNRLSQKATKVSSLEVLKDKSEKNTFGEQFKYICSCLEIEKKSR